MKRLFFTFVLILLALDQLLYASEKLITPGSFILKSSISPRQIKFVSPSHTFDIQKSGSYKEPYTPAFFLKDYDLPKNIAINTQPHWLSNFSSGLAKLFISEKFYLDSGTLLYSHHQYKEAIAAFKKGEEINGDLSDLFNLWLSWSYYQDNQIQKVSPTLSKILKSKNKQIRHEAQYLSALILIEKGAFQDVFTQLNQFQKYSVFSNWPFKLQYTYLISLTELHHWQDSLTYLAQMESQTIVHQKNFKDILKIKALALYHQKEYSNSISTLLRLTKIQSTKEDRFKSIRMLAWIYYLNKNYHSTLNQLNRIPAPFYFDELYYLKLSCNISLKNTKSAYHDFKKISPKSSFYIYAIFKLQILNDASKRKLSTDKNFKLNEDFSNLKFYSNLNSGNQYFLKHQFIQAENSYFRALSSDTDSKNYWMAHYNLALTYLSQKKYVKALNAFSISLKSLPQHLKSQIIYHRLYAYFGANLYQMFDNLLSEFSIDDFNRQQKSEILEMSAIIEHRRNNLRSAAKQFRQAWNISKKTHLFALSLESLYMSKNYTLVLKHSKTILKLKEKSERIATFYIKSLLALNKNKAALKEVESLHYSSESFNSLRIEVWFANDQNKKVIHFINAQLKHTPPSKTRLFYYLSLGDAYFNLKQYLKSKAQYYKALNIPSSIETKSVIYFNIATASQKRQDNRGFQLEVSALLKKKDITPDVRFNLTILLANTYIDSTDLNKADAILENYLSRSSFRSIDIRLKRIDILLRQKQYTTCYQLSQKKDKQENLFQQIDRLIFLSKCSQSTNELSNSSNLLAATIEENSSYRINERYAVLAQELFTLKQYKKSLQLIKKTRSDLFSHAENLTNQLLHSRILAQLKKIDEAILVLDPPEKFKAIQKFSRASILKSDLLILQGKFTPAEKTLLRAYYFKENPKKIKTELLFKLSVLNYTKKSKETAISYLKKINQMQLPNRYQDEYLRLKKALL